VEEKHVVAQIVKDELRHAAVMYGLLADLGVDVDKPRAPARRDLHDAHRARRRHRHPAHHRRQARQHLLLPDRHLAGLRLLQLLHGPGAPAISSRTSAAAPTAPGSARSRASSRRRSSTSGTASTGSRSSPRTRRPATRPMRRSPSGTIRTMNIFGRPGSPKNVRYRKYRLKTRDNDEVRQAFATEVASLCERIGLRVPAWKPVWEQLPGRGADPGLGAAAAPVRLNIMLIIGSRAAPTTRPAWRRDGHGARRSRCDVRRRHYSKAIGVSRAPALLSGLGSQAHQLLLGFLDAHAVGRVLEQAPSRS